MAIDADELKRVMSALGKRGGKARSKRKTEAARRNGRLAKGKPKRKLCANCGASLTATDRQAGACTQCGTAISSRSQPWN